MELRIALDMDQLHRAWICFELVLIFWFFRENLPYMRLYGPFFLKTLWSNCLGFINYQAEQYFSWIARGFRRPDYLLPGKIASTAAIFSGFKLPSISEPVINATNVATKTAERIISKFPSDPQWYKSLFSMDAMSSGIKNTSIPVFHVTVFNVTDTASETVGNVFSKVSSTGSLFKNLSSGMQWYKNPLSTGAIDGGIKEASSHISTATRTATDAIDKVVSNVSSGVPWLKNMFPTNAVVEEVCPLIPENSSISILQDVVGKLEGSSEVPNHSLNSFLGPLFARPIETLAIAFSNVGNFAYPVFTPLLSVCGLFDHVNCTNDTETGNATYLTEPTSDPAVSEPQSLFRGSGLGAWLIRAPWNTVHEPEDRTPANVPGPDLSLATAEDDTAANVSELIDLAITVEELSDCPVTQSEPRPIDVQTWWDRFFEDPASTSRNEGLVFTIDPVAVNLPPTLKPAGPSPIELPNVSDDISSADAAKPVVLPLTSDETHTSSGDNACVSEKATAVVDGIAHREPEPQPENVTQLPASPVAGGPRPPSGWGAKMLSYLSTAGAFLLAALLFPQVAVLVADAACLYAQHFGQDYALVFHGRRSRISFDLVYTVSAVPACVMALFVHSVSYLWTVGYCEEALPLALRLAAYAVAALTCYLFYVVTAEWFDTVVDLFTAFDEMEQADAAAFDAQDAHVFLLPGWVARALYFSARSIYMECRDAIPIHLAGSARRAELATGLGELMNEITPRRHRIRDWAINLRQTWNI